MRSVKDYLLLYVKGVSMGGADVIPGVSGGTIAFITGIYDELLHSIKSIDAEAIRLVFTFRIAEAWKKVNGNFLIVLLAGLATAWISLARVMKHLLENYQIGTWSFFFGLIIISTFQVLRQVRQRNIKAVLSFIVGVVIAYLITLLSPTSTPDALWFIFLAGAIAICAMILPGISGAFILLLMGKYEFILTQTLIEFNIPVIATFAAGCLVGLWAFSHALTWVLDHYHDLTVALLAGFMVGFLNKIWPWREATAYHVNSQGQQVVSFDKSVWPAEYLEKTGQNPQILYAILFAALGVLLVVGIEKAAALLKTK
ncbi:MAG: DUF368 domain-containing protein [Cyclobacteriaceae bacterium]|jgi:putative membrane protein